MFTSALAPTLRLWIASAAVYACCHLSFGQPTGTATLVSIFQGQARLTRTRKIDDGLGNWQRNHGLLTRVWPCTDFWSGVGIDREFGVSSSLSDGCDPYNLKPG
jgi:hypothetical protein